jgi:parallel beta-helix repeat protein
LKFVYADGVIVSDTYFYNTDFGLWLFHCDDVLIEGLTFDTVLYGVYAENSHRATINDCDFSDVTNRGIWMASCDNWVIFNNRFISVPTAIHLNSLCDNAEIYFNFFSGMTTYLDDSGVGTALTNGTYGNMYLEYPGYDYNGDLIGDTPYTFGSNTDSLPLMVWGSWPSTNPGWHVTVDTWCLATNFTLNGDVTIYSGATFRVYSATLWFNCSSDLEYGFFINDGGAIYYYNGGLRAYDVINQFDVHAYPDSFIHFDGVLLNGSYRILIDTNATYLNDLELHNAYDGICLQGSGNNLHGVTVTDCDFTDVENRGIHVGYCTGTTIIGCVFTNIGNRGIDLWYSADSVIADCTFAGVNDGVYMVLSTNTLLDNLSFAAVADDAIYAFACTDITMKNLQVTDADTGIYIQANIYGELTVFDSVFDDVQYGIRFNVWTSDDATLIVDNLTVSNIGQYGIEAQYLGNVTIIDSEFNVHGGVMIRVYYSVDWFYIEGCQGFNGSTGIYVYTGASGLIENCNFLNFTLGVDANGADVNITDSYFFGCTTGITANSALMNIIHNDFEHSETGVSTGTITNLVFANNTLTYMNNGFFSGGSIANVTLYGNTYSFFTYDAIGMTLGTSGGFIYNETINGCRYGILFQYAENVTIDLVTIINAERGLFLQWAVNPYITNVDISTCDVGIYIHDSASSTFRDCTITNTPEGIYFYIPSAEKGNHDFDSSNLYEGKPIYHFFDEIGTSHSGLDTYHLSISFCSFMTISESSIAGDRIYLVGLDNLTLANSTIGASFLIRDSHDMSINGNDFTSTEQITFSYEVTITNVTFTLNSFLTNYQFASSGFNLNASDYGNYWYNYPHDTDDNHDGIGDIPWVVNSMTDYLPLISPPYGYDVSTAILSPADAAHVGGSADVDIETILILGVYYVGSPSTSVSADVNGTEIWTGAIGAQSFSFDSTAFADGFYLLTITTLVDGSDAFTASIEFYIDNTAPVIYGMVPDNQYATSSSGLNPYGYFTDALSSIAWGAVYVDGSLEYNETSTMYSFALSFVDERGYNVTVVVMDTAGNIATGTLFYYYDATAPIISEPADLEYPLGSTGNVVTWTVTDLTGSHYNITLNGVSVFNGTLDSDTVEYNVDGLPIGSYSLQIRAYDRAGWESYDIVYVTVTESTTTTTTTTTITETTTTTTTTTGLPPPPPDGILIIVLAIGGIAAVAIVVVVLIMMRRKAAA